jgi:hypothetical protein
VLAFMLHWIQSRLERRLARLHAAFEGSLADPAPGGLAAEAATARARIDDARHALEAAELALGEGGVTR